MTSSDDSAEMFRQRGHFLEILGAFAWLGIVAFGGPVAHLGYFREEFVKRRRWISDAGYADLVALAQMLPGPASSQVGFSLGVLRGGGLVGGLAAWLGFTLPSALVLIAFAAGTASFVEPWQIGLLHGFRLVAVAIVAHAIWGMIRSLAWDRRLIAIALAALVLTLALEGGWSQILVIAMGALAGFLLMPRDEALSAFQAPVPVSRRAGAVSLALFAVLLAGLPVLSASTGWHGLQLFDGFYRSGALVFGGGHVVLPLLHDVAVTPGWVGDRDFVTGYGVTQAMPGPVFTFAAYLGATAQPSPNGLAGGLIALVAIFLPGLLVMHGVLPFWSGLRRLAGMRAAMRGVNAAVIGLLAAAFYQPLWTSTIAGADDVLVAVAGFALLTMWRKPAWLVVIALGAAGILRALL
ncbi:chromate efflux transporter [Labrys monachus]|uniref:Chromate transporter n=1 Tax=Labrys monachus TaxID=217067 RepID=A0ABU0FC73_9HYPH|nr:chromate efflux transporter [Labrys monachus]MDQ0392217.1 chromate transporter [Labrys monachus]